MRQIDTITKDFFSQPFRVEQAGRVSGAAVAQQGDYRVAGPHLFCQLNRGGHVDAARAADVQAFLAQQAVDHLHARLVVDADGVVDRCALQVCGDPAVADAFRNRIALALQFAVLDPVVERAAVGIGQHDFYVRLLLLQVAGDAGQGAASAGSAGESVDAAMRVVPDFWAGCCVVCLAVGEIVELLGPDGVGQFLCEAAGDFLVIVVVGVGDGFDGAHFGAKGAQDGEFFLGLGFGDDDHAFVAACGAQVGQADAGVAGGAFDDGAAGFQAAGALGVEDDGEGGAVFDGAAGVHELGFGQDFAAGLGRETGEADQGSMADGVGEALAEHDFNLAQNR